MRIHNAMTLFFMRSALALGLLLMLTTEMPGYADQTVIVDPTIQYQTMEGWGTSLCWWAHVIGGFPDEARKDYIQKVFDAKHGLGLNIVRYNIGGGENPTLQAHSMEYRSRIPGYEPSPGVWDWNADTNQRWVIQAAKKSGVNLFEAFSNSPPYWMTLSGSVAGAQDGGSNLTPAHADDFAEYLTTVVKHFHDQWGITFHTLEPFNESADYWWKYGGHQEGCHFDAKNDTGNDQNTLAKKVGILLTAQHSPTLLSASDDNSIDTTLRSFSAYDDSAKAMVSQVNTHSYGGSDRVRLREAAHGASKRLWMSEYGDGDASGLTMSRRILEDMKILRPTAWVYWQAIDGGGGWGFLSNPLHDETTTEYTINEKYYVMGNYSKFIRPGYQFIEIDDPNSLAAYDAKSHTLVIVTTNTEASDRPVIFDLTRFHHVSDSATVYRTSPDEKLASLTPQPIASGQLVSSSKGASVTTYVIHAQIK